MPNLFDHVFFAVVIAVVPAFQTLSYPALRRALEADRAGMRVAAYRHSMLALSGLTAACLLGWLVAGRAWGELGFAAPAGGRFWLGVPLGGVVLAVMCGHHRRITRDPASADSALRNLRRTAALLPHTRHEMVAFTQLSIAAGVCEETLYRGFAIWYIAELSDLWLAVGLSSLAFAVGHLYQGIRDASKVFVAALVAAGLYVLTGSLWVPMALHAAVDILQGRFAYGLLTTRQRPAVPAAGAPGTL